MHANEPIAGRNRGDARAVIELAADKRKTLSMTTAPTTVAAELVDAIVARDFTRVRGLLHPDIDFRAMTPSRIWEADGPAGVEDVLRAWLADPDEDIDRIDPTEPNSVEDTARVGWRVHGSSADGTFAFEQQAYMRDRDGQIGWLRVMCSGTRPIQAGPGA